MRFVFYDTETTGTNPFFDQMLQFGAICLDEEFQEVGRFETRVRLAPHVLPSLGAMLVTGITPATLSNKSLPTRYHAYRQIAQKLKDWSPARFIGYNSINFDEVLLREAFYQTLQPIYLTNTSGNSRGDALRLAQASYALAPGTLSFTQRNEKAPSFKLDQLAPANGFAHVDAHDAVGDVEATIYLCKLVRKRAPKLWHSFLDTMQKSRVIAACQSSKYFQHVTFLGGEPSSGIFRYVGERNGLIVGLNICGPLTELGTADASTLVSFFKAPRGFLRRIRANAQPIVIPLSPLSAAEHAGVTASKIEEIERFLSERRRFPEDVLDAVAFEESEWSGSIPDMPIAVESQIYERFASREDEIRMRAFHDARSWEARLAIALEMEDPRFKELGVLLVYEECPEALGISMRREVEVKIARRLLTDNRDVPWTTLPMAREQIEEHRASNGNSPAIDALERFFAEKQAQLLALSAAH